MAIGCQQVKTKRMKTYVTRKKKGLPGIPPLQHMVIEIIKLKKKNYCITTSLPVGT